MQKNKVLRSGSNPKRSQFTTIDDALEILPGLERLAVILKDLGDRKHPLAVRRGVGAGMNKTAPEKSIQVKGCGSTYFLDLQKAKSGRRYLRITQSRKSKGNSFERRSIYIVPDDAKEVSEKIIEMIRELG